MRRVTNPGLGVAAALALLHYAERATLEQSEPVPVHEPTTPERKPGESRQVFRARLRAHAKGRRA